MTIAAAYIYTSNSYIMRSGIRAWCSQCHEHDNVSNSGPGFRNLCSRCYAERMATYYPRWADEA